MCTWMTSLPQRSNSVAMEKKQNIMMFLKPTEEKEYYRFRLLAYKSSKNDRDFPWIERFTHIAWGKKDDGKPCVESQVICPVTKHVHWEENPYDSCPICRCANNNFIAFKESGWKDKEANKKAKQFGRKFEALIPVWCVNDPTYEGNNGKLKVFSFSDKDVYKQFKDMVNAKSREAAVFNGGEALDFFIRLERKTETMNAGQPNEYTWSHNVVSKMGFTTKPYAIPGITKEAIDNFEFDDQFYVSSTKEELQEFYNKYCKVNMDDIPDDDVAVVVPKAPAPKPVYKTNDVEKSVAVTNEAKAPVAAEATPMPFDDDIDDLLGESKPESKPAADPAPTPAPAPAPTPTPAPKSDDDINLDDIDDLMKDL